MRARLWVCLVLLPSPAVAQGSLTGVVTDRGDALLPADTYTVRFLLPGFDTLVREDMEVTGSVTQTLDASLRFAVAAQTPPAAPPFRDADRRCLHGDSESAAERARREDALAAMRMIDGILATFPPLRTESPSWDEVSASPAVTRLRSQGNDLANRVRWGTREPLPGWGLAWVTSRDRSRFALIDLRDPCGFSYSSEEDDVVPPGRQYRIIPLSS